MTFRGTVLSLLAALLTACGGERSSSANTVADSAGVRIVTSRASAWSDVVRLDSTPLVRMGSEEPGPYLLTFISMGVLLDTGSFAIAELATGQIRFYDATGQHTRAFGGRGRGPGEFQVISGLFRGPGDSLIAFDQVERRVTIVPPPGSELRTVLAQSVPEERGRFDAFGALEDGRLLLYNPGAGFRPDLETGLQWVTTAVAALDPADGTARTLVRLPSRQQFVLPGGDTKPIEPANYAIRAVAKDGFYWGTSDRYEIRFHAATGAVRRIMRRPVGARPVTPAMIDAWTAARLEEVRLREGEAAVERYRQVFAQAEFADSLPHFERAIVDGDGRLWVSASTWAAAPTADVPWSVFDESGRWLGDVDVPGRLRILDVRDGRVLGVWQEPGEAPEVRVYRVERLSGR